MRKVIAESLCVDLDDVTRQSNLIKDLGAESIDFLDIMFRLEKEFDIPDSPGGRTDEPFDLGKIEMQARKIVSTGKPAPAVAS